MLSPAQTGAEIRYAPLALFPLNRSDTPPMHTRSISCNLLNPHSPSRSLSDPLSSRTGPPIVPSLPLNDSHPVLPLFRDLHQYASHHARTGHQSMTLTLQYPDLAPSHRLSQPFDIFHWHSRVSTTVMDHHRACDIDIPESDSLSPLKAHKQIDGRIGMRSCKIPDSMCKTRIVGRLALLLSERGGRGDENRVLGFATSGFSGSSDNGVVAVTVLELSKQERVSTAGNSRPRCFTSTRRRCLSSGGSNAFTLCPPG